MRLQLPRIYPITDTSLSALSHTEQVRRLIDGGADFIQLREKHRPAREFYEDAREAIVVARPRGVKIIINDRVDIALALNADGVHLDQDDLLPEQARKILGPDPIIGFSTHSVEQARAASNLPIDYVAIGPIFDTTTKEDPDPVVGVNGLRAVREAIRDMPLVAIGGIADASVRPVLKAGADSVAIISGLIADPDRITHRVAELLAA